MASVAFEHVTKDFPTKRGAVRAVDDFSLAVPDGELVVLLGPSGCGKTTTLRLLAGLEQVSSGTIRIGERVVNEVAPKDRDVAMVCQDYALYPHMTVFQNLAFGLQMRHTPKQEVQHRVEDVAQALRISELLPRRPATLSGGERQRVALGRAIVRKPNVFLFDEPLASLDVRLRRQIRAEIRTLHREQGITMLYVTHDQEEAMSLGDRIVVLDAGRVQQTGRPLDVYRQPANLFVASFVGTPPMNFLPGRLEDAGPSVRFVWASGQAEWPKETDGRCKPFLGRDIILGIRPEHLHLANEELRAVGRHRSGLIDGLTALAELPVRWVEPLGECTIVHLQHGPAETLLARASPTTDASPGQRVRVLFDLEQAHFFSQDASGCRLA